MMEARMENRRVVLVTGAAGGLGQGLVRAFLAADCQVYAGWHETPLPGSQSSASARNAEVGALCSRTEAAHEASVEARATTAAEPSSAAIPVRLDVSDPGSARRAVDRIREDEGRLDVLVNNAGVISDAPLWATDEDAWERVLEINLKGAFRCAQAVVSLMDANGGGHMINIGSYSGCVGAKGQANYAAAKAGVFGLTQSLAAELGPRNIRVNALCPGFLDTGMTQALSEAERARISSANVLGRTGTIVETARFVVFLAAMEHVSGQLFSVDSRLLPWT